MLYGVPCNLLMVTLSEICDFMDVLGRILHTLVHNREELKVNGRMGVCEGLPMFCVNSSWFAHCISQTLLSATFTSYIIISMYISMILLDLVIIIFIVSLYIGVRLLESKITNSLPTYT